MILELSKKNILSLIEKNKKKDFKIINLNIFGNEILLDIETNNPTLQSKKNIENSIKEIISENFIEKVELKINFKIEKTESPQNQIKGNPIKGIQNVIAIASGKGGVGKSTVTSNIAITLSKMGFKVGILDADIYGPSIPIMFDIANERPLSVNVDGKNKMKPIESYGVKILSIGFFTISGYSGYSLMSTGSKKFSANFFFRNARIAFLKCFWCYRFLTKNATYFPYCFFILKNLYIGVSNFNFTIKFYIE